jgi:hypothetical protein
VHGAGYIEKFTTNGAGSVFVSGLYDPVGIAFDTAGNLFATSTGDSNSIVKIAPDGTGSIYAVGLDVPNFIAMQPVPEPACAAFLIGSYAIIRLRRMKS